MTLLSENLFYYSIDMKKIPAGKDGDVLCFINSLTCDKIKSNSLSAPEFPGKKPEKIHREIW